MSLKRETRDLNPLIFEDTELPNIINNLNLSGCGLNDDHLNQLLSSNNFKELSKLDWELNYPFCGIVESIGENS